jgi:hypothetical protein
MTKRPQPSTKLAVSRKGDVFLLTAPNYWGKGATLAEAKRKLREVSGRPMIEHKAWRVYSAHPSTYLQEMGYINHPTDHPPIMLAEYNPVN